MVVYTLYLTCDVNQWLFGHSERPFSCRTSHAPSVRTRTPPTCSILNFNPDQLQQLEAIQGIELMPSDLFFLIALVILVSNNVDFDPRLLLADGLTADRRPGPRRLPQPLPR
jgi:hypothetical protein